MVVKEVAKDEVWFSDSVQVFDRHVPILLELSSCFWFCLTELVLLCWTSMVICAILVSPSNFEEFIVRVYDSLTGFVYLWFIHTRVRSVACDRGLGAELVCDFRWDPFRVECSFVKYFFVSIKSSEAFPSLRGLCCHAQLVIFCEGSFDGYKYVAFT